VCPAQQLRLLGLVCDHRCPAPLISEGFRLQGGTSAHSWQEGSKATDLSRVCWIFALTRVLRLLILRSQTPAIPTLCPCWKSIANSKLASCVVLGFH